MKSQKLVISTIKAKSGNTMYIKKCSKAQKKGAKEIYQALKLKEMTFWKKVGVLKRSRTEKK